MKHRIKGITKRLLLSALYPTACAGAIVTIYAVGYVMITVEGCWEATGNGFIGDSLLCIFFGLMLLVILLAVGTLVILLLMLAWLWLRWLWTGYIGRQGGWKETP